MGMVEVSEDAVHVRNGTLDIQDVRSDVSSVQKTCKNPLADSCEL